MEINLTVDKYSVFFKYNLGRIRLCLTHMQQIIIRFYFICLYFQFNHLYSVIMAEKLLTALMN